MSPDREADLSMGSRVEPSDRVPTLRLGSTRCRPRATERAREVTPHLDHRDPPLADPDAVRMRVLQGNRHTSRCADEPLRSVRSDLDPGREPAPGACLRLPVTTTRGASERKNS